MARKKKKNKKTAFKFGSSAKRTRPSHGSFWKFILIILSLVLVITAVAVGFYFLEKYVTDSTPLWQSEPVLELLDVPVWVNDHLKARLRDAAMFYDYSIESEKDTAQIVQQNIEKNLAWVSTVGVQRTHESIKIKAEWRKPLALVKRGLTKYYLDAELVVLDFVPLNTLPIVRITGLPLTAKPSSPGYLWQRDDIAAAIAILERLDRMDKLVTPDKPLLFEIDRINISNFDGRRSSAASHIILYTKDNTQIIWGAELDKWQRHLEATDEEKLAKLYGYYTEHNLSLAGVKYINLRDPRDQISQPIDKY